MAIYRSESRDTWRINKRANYNKAKYAKSAVSNRNRMQRYTTQDINAILDKAKADLELSKDLGRSVQAIHVMRSRLKGEAR